MDLYKIAGLKYISGEMNYKNYHPAIFKPFSNEKKLYRRIARRRLKYLDSNSIWG